MYRLRKFLFITVTILFSLSFLPAASAQTKSQMHKVAKDPEKNYVHAQVDEEIEPETSWKPETIATSGRKSDSSPNLFHLSIDGLFEYTTSAGFIYLCILTFLLLFFVFRYRERPGHKAYYTHGKKEKKITLICDLIFFVTLDVILISNSMFHNMDYISGPPQGEDIVRVQVMPQQWVWNFRYEGKDKMFNTADDVVTVNELWLPKGKTVYLQIKSKDVVHGFMVPGIRRQMDAIPGTITRLWFDLTKNGDFEIACYHLCGTAHYKMKAFLKVVEQNDFNLWSNEMSEWSAARFDPDDIQTHWGWEWGLN